MKTTLPNLIFFEQVTSTNQVAAEWLAQGHTDHGDFFIADYQTAGRGYGQNSWFSSPNLNLLGTLLVSFENFPAQDQFLITCVVSTIIAEFIEVQTSEKAFIKWPNDVFVSDKKICGLLIQNQSLGSELRTSLIGIGLNVNETEFPANLPHAISMFQLDNKLRNVEQIALHLGGNILQALASHEGARLYWAKYLEKMYRLGTPALYRYNDKIALGIIHGIDEFGRLLLHFDNHDLVLDFKEVEYIL